MYLLERMPGYTTTKILFEPYERFIQYRTRQDGSAYLEASSLVQLSIETQKGLRNPRNPFIFRAGPTRLELATSGVTGRRSNQLNYDPRITRWAEQGLNL